MNGYTDGRLLVVKQLQAERRAEGAGNRLGLDRAREEAVRERAARVLATVLLVVLALAALAGAGTGPGAAALLGTGATPLPGLP